MQNMTTENLTVNFYKKAVPKNGPYQVIPVSY